MFVELYYYWALVEEGGWVGGWRCVVWCVDSQAEEDAAELPQQAGWQAGRQTDREEKVLEKNSMIAWSHAGSRSSFSKCLQPCMVVSDDTESTEHVIKKPCV